MARRGFVGWTRVMDGEPVAWPEVPTSCDELDADIAYLRQKLFAALTIPSEFLRDRDHVVVKGQGR